MAAKSGSNFDYFANADGTYTRKFFQGRVNYKTSSGGWQSIDTELTKGGDGRYHEKDNSLGVAFAASSGAASLSTSSTSKSGSGARPASAHAGAEGAHADSAALVSPASLPWRMSPAVYESAGSSSVVPTDSVTTGNSSTGPLATLTLSSSESVSWSLQGASDVPVSVSGSTAEYDGILTDTKLVLQPTADGIKESLVLTSASAPTTWVFPMSLKGLSLSTASDGTVELVDSSGAVRATLPQAFAYDSFVDPVSGERHENWAMTYSVTSVDGSPAVKMTLDPNWLAGSSIRFPVTVDPTMTASTAGQKLTTYVEYPYNQDFSSSNVLKIGTYDGGGHIAESYLKFPGIPRNDGYHITAASVSVFDIWSYTCGSSSSYSVYPVTTSWYVTGSKSWPGPSTASSIGTWSGTPSSTVCSNSSLDPSTGQWQTTNLSTSYWQDIALGTTTDNGVALFSSGTNNTGWKQFDSSHVTSHAPYLTLTYAPNVAPDIEHTWPKPNYAAPSLTPQLQVQAVDPDTWPNSFLTYDFAVYDSSGSQITSSGYHSSVRWTVPSGKLAWGKSYYWTVSAYDGWSTKTSATSYFTPTVAQPLVASRLAQNSGHGFDEVAGNYTTSVTDAQVAGVGPALDVERSYNSQDMRTSGAFGAGWSAQADAKAVMDDDGSKNVVITDGSGRQSRYGYSSSGYVPPQGTYATLTDLSGGGYSLLDTSGTTYTFGASGGTNTWLLSKITTHAGLSETFTYNASHQLTQAQNTSGRSLYFTWSTPSGAAHPHVATVTTDDATAGDASTAILWTYGYSGDQLTSVCPPSESAPATASTSCYAYTYTAGSDYPAAALDAGPHSYWRLDEPSGSSMAASSVLANEQNDVGTYKNVTLGSDPSPLAGSSATAAHFNGSSSHVSVPSDVLHQSTSRAVSLWFKTSSPGVLIGDQSKVIDGTSGASGTWNPVLYVGSDGKLHGHWWSVTGSGSDPFGSTGTVNDNAWHHAVLSSDGATQTLYVDGSQQATFSGTPSDQFNTYTYIGAGYAQYWIDSPGDVSYFSGSISDVAFYTHPLTASQVADLHAFGTTSAAYLTGAAKPSGRVQASVFYDRAASRVTAVTDEHGGSWQVGAPSVAGSSAVYRASVLGAGPAGYWRLGDLSAATYAADEVNGGDGTYNNVTLGVSGPLSSKDSTAGTAASFDGSTSYVSAPADLLHQSTSRAVSLWFKTSAPGVLIGDQSVAIDGTTTASGTWDPVLYVGSDGKLHGHWWSVSGSGGAAFGSTGTVTDNAWHHAVLTSNGTTQTLYLDGTQQGTFSGTPNDQSNTITYIGAGYAKSWIDSPAEVSYFPGSIAEVAFYQHSLTAAQATDQWNAYQQSSGTVATETVTVTDPGNKSISSSYDLSHGARIISATDARGAQTSYGYDTSGYLHTLTDPDGDVTTTGHDARGNTVSKTTCQSQASNLCSTSYYTYYLNSSSATDPRNDKPLTSSDGRSASSSDTTYRTSYTYDTDGNLLTSTTPAVTGHSSGLTTTNTYTTSSTAGYDSGTTVPAGLKASAKTPGGATTSYTYYADGDLAQEVTPLGLTIRYTYDGLGRVLTRTEISDTYPSGLTTSYTYDPLGRVLTRLAPATTDAVSGSVHTARTTLTYDTDGNVLTSTVSDTTGSDTARTTTTAYNNHGEVASVTDPEQHTTTYTYDTYGHRTGESDPGGQTYAYTYDADGNRLTTTLTNYTGSSATAQNPTATLLETRTYDPAGRLATLTDPIGVTTTYAYYDNGLTQQVTHTGASGTSSISEQDTYDAAGNLIATTTENGTLTTDYTVDAAGRTTAATVDPGGTGQTTAYTFDADSHILTVNRTDTAGDPAQQWTYTYDAAGNKLSAAQYVDSTTTLTTHWTYDQRGLAVTVTDPESGVHHYTNDEAGRLTTTTDPAITTTDPATGTTATVYPTTLAGYDTFGERTESEDPDGNIIATAYDRDGRRTGTTLPTLATTAWTYDADGNVLTETDAKGNQTDYAYDQLGDQVKRTDPAIDISGTPTRGTFTYSYDLAGNQLTQTSPYGSVTHRTYDDLGRATSTWGYVYTSTSTQTKEETDTAYNTAGLPATTTSATGVSASYTYDALGNTLTRADTTGDTTHYTYDLRGNVVKTVLPDQSIQTATYDAAGRKTATAQKAPDGTVLASTSATYSPGGHLLSTTDALGHTTGYTYDAAGDLTGQSEPVSGTTSITTAFGYDAAGHQTAYTDGNGNTTYYTYNSLGLPASKEVPAVTGYTTAADRTTTYTYDALGELTGQSDPGGITLTNAYDALGDLTSQSATGADAPTATRTFDYSLDRHLVASAVDGMSETYGSNALGDVLTVSGQAGNSSFTYNADESPLTRIDASGTSTYTYDSDGRPATDTDAATGTTLTYGYNSLSQLTTVTYGSSGDVRSYGYDGLHRETSDTLATASGTTVAKAVYGWDEAGDLTSKTTTGVQGASTNTYGYDHAGRLTSWTKDGTTTAYTYDGAGNRLTAGSTTYTYNARDQLTSDGTHTYTYTARGTLASKDSTAYTFDAYGQQITAGSTSYTYDALGRAITAGSTTLTYSGTGNMVASDGATTYSRDASGALAGESGPTGATLAWTDLHGDLVGQFTATGTTLTGSASYDPWGTVTASTLAGTVGYQGEFTDPATGNVNMHARWYTPDTGGFNSADTVDVPAVGRSADANPYAYVADAPLTGTDPSGHCIEDLCIGEFFVAGLMADALYNTCVEYCSGLGNSLSNAWNSVSSWSSSSSSTSHSHAS
ncbi:LamG-like jellyroll fold domain-containing protein, partial [Streptomyces caeni]